MISHCANDFVRLLLEDGCSLLLTVVIVAQASEFCRGSIGVPDVSMHVLSCWLCFSSLLLMALFVSDVVLGGYPENNYTQATSFVSASPVLRFMSIAKCLIRFVLAPFCSDFPVEQPS